MIAELTEVRGRSARWRFALSSARATLLLPPAGGWPMLALVAGAAAVVTTAVGPVVMPALKVFAMTFAGLVGTVAVLAVARSRRPRLSVPTLVVVAAVAASIASTVYLLHRAPTAAVHLPPAAAVFLALGLACCLCVASTPQGGGLLDAVRRVRAGLARNMTGAAQSEPQSRSSGGALSTNGTKMASQTISGRPSSVVAGFY